jgi:hypothetical protein
MSPARSVLAVALVAAAACLALTSAAYATGPSSPLPALAAQGAADNPSGAAGADPSQPASKPTSGSPSVLDEWKSWGYWLLLLLVLVFGAGGGVIYELLSLGGRLERPHATTADEMSEELEGTLAGQLYDLGIFARMMIGGAAALVVFWLLNLQEQGATAVLAGALLAGATGGAIFRSLKDRLLAALAGRELAQTRELAAQQSLKVAQLDQAFTQLKGKLTSSSISPLGGRLLDFSKTQPIELPELDQVDSLLGEARALSLAATARPTASVRLRVLETLGAWAGVELAEVGPDSKKITDLWHQNSANPALDDGHLSDLIVRLKQTFPQAGLRLAPNDLKRDSGVPTVGQLIGHVELRMLPRRIR